MSSMWMFGRFWVPPKMVIRRWVTARLVRMFTVRSSRMRRVSAHGGRPDDDGGEGGALVAEQDGLAHALVLVVVGQRTSGWSSVTSGASLTPHARGGRVDELPHTHLPRLRHQRLEAVVVDGAAQRRVQLEAGIVRDAGEVDHRVHVPEALLDRHRVAQVALDQLELDAAAASSPKRKRSITRTRNPGPGSFGTRRRRRTRRRR